MNLSTSVDVLSSLRDPDVRRRIVESVGKPDGRFESFGDRRGKSGLPRAGRSVTPTRRETRASAAESKPPNGRSSFADEEFTLHRRKLAGAW